MKSRNRIELTTLALSGVLLLAAALCPAETITLMDDGTATDSIEGIIISDTYCSGARPDLRGRWSDKLYMSKAWQTPDNDMVAAIQFHDLESSIGEGKTIVSAKLIFQCTNASGPKPIEVIAYPFLQEWGYNRMNWTLRMFDGKLRKWNVDPENINLDPAPTTSEDVNIYDFAEKCNDVWINAKGLRAGTMDNTSLSGGLDAEFDVTEIVKLWYDGTLPNNGLALVAQTPGTYIRFWATNGEGEGPKLVIEVEGESEEAAE